MSNNADRVAIIGMSCRFAGCADLRSFWMRILTGQPAFSDNQDADALRFVGSDKDCFERVPSLRAGYLKELWQINPSSVDTSSATMPGTNPECALAADLFSLAMRDADFASHQLPHDRIGLIVGYSPYMDEASVNWCQHGIVIDQTLDIIRRCFPHGSTKQFEALRSNLQEALPQYDSRNILSLFNNAITTQISKHFDISGPTYCVNSDSISGLLTIRSACDELLDRRADIIVAGAVQGPVTPQLLMPFNKMGVLSCSDTPHPFGRDADGMLAGEGGGMIVLKRYDDAIRDNDRIYAIVRAVGVAAEGSRKIKSGDGLSFAIRNACSQGNLHFNSLAFIEANGIGIPQSDRIEVRAMTQMFEDFADRYTSTVALGTIKALIGHSGAASGIAGAIKAALSLYHRIIPPAQESRTPNEQIKFGETPFYLNLSPRPWIHNDAGLPRRAGVSSISFSGTAAHMVLEQDQSKS